MDEISIEEFYCQDINEVFAALEADERNAEIMFMQMMAD